MGRNPSKSVGPDKPVERVSWLAAIQYCNMRSPKEGLKPCYDLKAQPPAVRFQRRRLPAAHRGRMGICLPGGHHHAMVRSATIRPSWRKYAWFKGNADKTTHPVKQKQPNPWGLYDMYGNVAQWCNDFYQRRLRTAGRGQGPARAGLGHRAGDARRQFRQRRRRLPLVGQAEPNARLRRHLFRIRDLRLPLRPQS